MLGSTYLSINGTAVSIPPKKFSIDEMAVENVKTSEAGTDLVITARLNKHKFSASWDGVDATFADTVKAWCELATVTLGFRNGTYTCRARGYKADLIRGAYAYAYSDGLYNVSVTFTEI